MEYFIAAWHNQLVDWAHNVPRIEFYDQTTNMKILRKSGRKVGLVLTDYQPQLTTKFDKIDFYPDEVFSVFDFLQGIRNGLSNRVLDYQDLKWPDDVIFDITPFRILAISDDRLYAKIIFDSKGRLLAINYYDADKTLTHRLVIDSRGFISSKMENNIITYYDPAGHWRFTHDRNTDEIVVNPAFHITDQYLYADSTDLVNEVIYKYFLPQVTDKDDLIVTLDDKIPIPLKKYEPYNCIFSLNEQDSYQISLAQVKKGQIVVPSKDEVAGIKKQVADEVPVTAIPTFPYQPNFGHSQRIKRQIIAIFAEYSNFDELKKLMDTIYPRLINNPDGEGVYFISYNDVQLAMVQRVIDQLMKEHPNEFVLYTDQPKAEDELIDELTETPRLFIKTKRLSSIAEAMNFFDKIRLLVNWNSPDDFIMSTAVSVGIPQLQNFSSSTLVDHANGILCNNFGDLAKGLAYYLDSLQNWNQALVYDAQLLNKYSEEKLIDKWNHILDREK